MVGILETVKEVGGGVAAGHLGLLLDVCIALVFLLFAVARGKKGFYNTVIGVIICVLALAAGIVCSSMFTDAAADKLWPKVSEKVSESFQSMDISEAIVDLSKELDAGVSKVLKIAHLDDDAQDAFFDSLALSYTKAGEDKVLPIVQHAFRQVVSLGLFIGFTFLALLILRPLSRAFGKINDLPVIGTIDFLGGFALGFMECFILFYIFVKFCSLQDYDWFGEIAAQSVILSRIAGL